MNIVAHNMLAMNAGRQLGITNKNKAKSTEKLSSGYRINRAADDAAGLSISEKMRRQIRGLSQGIENTEDGVSLCQVADGALAEVTKMLHRITELSVQSANGTYSDDDRQAIQQEISQILQEVDRIGDTTRFNEIPLFKGRTNVNQAGMQDNISTISKSIRLSGTPQNLNAGTYQIKADENGIYMNQEKIAWGNVVDKNGDALDLQGIKAGEYSFDYHGVTMTIQLQGHESATDVLTAIGQVSFDVVDSTTSFQAVSVQDYGVDQGTETDRFLSSNGTRYRYPGGYALQADDYGIRVAGRYTANTFTRISWNSLGIDDLDNAAGKTIQFKDPESGVHFNATIQDGATKQDILDSINQSTFYWGYIDMSTRENARLGYSASSLTNTITNKEPPVVRANSISVNKIYDQLFDKLGYSSMSDKLNDLKLEITISGSTKNDLRMELKDTATGNKTYLGLYSWDPGIYHYANPSGTATAVFGYNMGAQIRLRMSYSTVHVPADEDAIAYLGTLGTVAKDVIIPSPYYFKYDIGGIEQTEYKIDNVVKDAGSSGTSGVDSRQATQLWIQSGSEPEEGMYLEIDPMNASILEIQDIDVSTESGAGQALDFVQGALKKISANRSKIGAQQNRLEYTITNESNTVENLTSAESEIRDTDMAREMVEFSRKMILDNVGQAMLAQANKSNQAVLSLLSL